ncbi:MAG: RagB/SusD family nutrient uptake outer membrane protein [Candidatus Azobacteroides sp.]|nr:RagB/SusD family nutrient uptake outer membrane protein [Candidatus Azobacteroides sp.]
MKKILFLIGIISIWGFNSCSDFLEENPRSQQATKSNFSSAADGYAAVNILYHSDHGFPNLFNAGSAYVGPNIMYGGYLSGLFDNQYKGQEIFVQYCQNLQVDANVSNSQLQGIWEPIYRAIVREANYAIKYLPDCPGLSDAEKNQLIAEAKFFRALSYFYLVKMFGPVPLIEEPYESLDNLYVPRSTEVHIYEFIVKDLEDALANGGLKDSPMPKNGFRISKGSVSALLADVYLNMAGYPVNDASKYAEAARVARTLINNPNYQLIQNLDKGDNSAYNILRTSDSEDEYLYTIEYDATIANGGWRPIYCFPTEAATWGEFTYNISCLVYNPAAVLHAAYDIPNDLRHQEHQYFHSKYTQTKGPTAGTVHDLGGWCPYFWYEEDALLNTNRSQKDQVHYRLTEMYLIAAEAIAQTSGVTDEAAGYLAEIEARASLNKTEDQIKSELLSLSKDNFIREVWREKIREFIFENKIWNDITRTRMYPALVGGQFTFVNVIGAQNPWGKTFAEKDLLFPICSQEMQRNPRLSEPPI